MPVVESFHALFSLRRVVLGVFLLLTLVLIAPAFAEHYTAYAWIDANLALIYPDGWSAPVPTSANNTLTLTLDGGTSTLTLMLLPPSTPEAAIRPALETQVAALNVLPLKYALAPLYGRSGLQIQTVSADRSRVGLARSGRLPDDRVLLIVGGANASDSAAFQSDFDAVLASLVFSSSAPPVQPTYHALWSVPKPSGAQSIDSLTVANHRLYVLADDGIHILNVETGAPLASFPIDHPAVPTGLVVDSSGLVSVSDTVCRCIRQLTPAGRWLDPLGSFGPDAPFSLSVAPDGTLYAIDRGSVGYTLRVLTGSRSRTVALDFNGSAPPLVTVDEAGQVWVIQWLASLIDGSISGAASLVANGKPDLRFWLETLAPQKVNALTTDPDGDLVLAAAQGVLVVNTNGQTIDQFDQAAPPAQLTFAADGTLYTASADGTLAAFTARGAAADRTGSPALTLATPVLGVVSEAAPQQDWTYSGMAGQIVTVSAIDQTRPNPNALGLDMALHLLAPDGREIAANDDQTGTDLYGVYDSEISAFTLPQTGTYTVRVEWRQGQGMYTLGIAADQRLNLDAAGVTRITGQLQDVFPIQRWDFTAHKDDVFTFTMSADDKTSTLDPALALFKPDGTLLEYDDDAVDPQLGHDAQLTGVHLPVDGTYTLEATRNVGVGSYTLIIVTTSNNG